MFHSKSCVQIFYINHVKLHFIYQKLCVHENVKCRLLHDLIDVDDTLFVIIHQVVRVIKKTFVFFSQGNENTSFPYIPVCNCF